MDYDVCCRQDPSRNPYSLKIIDSMPGSKRTFQADVDAFMAVTTYILQDNWSDVEHKNDMKQRLESLRAYLRHVTASMEMGTANEYMIDSVLLPSTTQLGLECIIITLCRVIATWVTPYEIPLEDCQPLCRNKRGRRSLCELMLIAHDQLHTDEEPQSPSTFFFF